MPSLEGAQFEVQGETGVRGHCWICGETTEFAIEESEWGHLRESMHCTNCWTSSRKRHVVKLILTMYARGARSLIEAKSQLQGLRIYSAMANDCFHRILGPDNPNFFCSEYFPGVPEGEFHEGIMCQNLENLTYDSEQFDLVITEDVFEHVRKPYLGFREVARVLRPRGHHVFTIPFVFESRTNFRVDTSGADRMILPPEYHIDKLRNEILVYTEFGYDLLDELKSIGFRTTVKFSLFSEGVQDGVADSYVFISQKVG